MFFNQLKTVLKSVQVQRGLYGLSYHNKLYYVPIRYLCANTGASGNFIDTVKSRHFCTKPPVESTQINLSKFAEEWWDTKGYLRALHEYNALRVPFIIKGLQRTTGRDVPKTLPLKGFKILDVGCGGGILTEALAKEGAELTGLDTSVELLDVAKSHAKLSPDLSVSYVYNMIECYSLNFPEHYDAIVVSEVLEHIDEKQLFLKTCVEALKPGGSIFITTFNKTIYSYVTAILMLEKVFRIIPNGTHDWRMFISPQNTAEILEKYNCGVTHVEGIKYNILVHSWSWAKHWKGSYALHAIKKC